MESSTDGKTVMLKTYDGEEFVLPETLAMHCQTIRHLIEDKCADDTIPIPNVNARTLRKLIEYCQTYTEVSDALKSEENSSSTEGSSNVTEKLKNWEQEFLDLDVDVIYDLLLAANYLEFSKLLEATTQKVANMIKGKSAEEIRKTFNIENDFTPEEEEQIRRENQWAFE